MTKPREKTREEVTAEIGDGKKNFRQLESREKVLRQIVRFMHCSRWILSQATPFSVNPLTPKGVHWYHN